MDKKLSHNLKLMNTPSLFCFEIINTPQLYVICYDGQVLQYCIVYLCYTFDTHSYNNQIPTLCSQYVNIALVGFYWYITFRNFILKHFILILKVLSMTINPSDVVPSFTLIFLWLLPICRAACL